MYVDVDVDVDVTQGKVGRSHLRWEQVGTAMNVQKFTRRDSKGF